jgi:hypothetical protein
VRDETTCTTTASTRRSNLIARRELKRFRQEYSANYPKALEKPDHNWKPTRERGGDSGLVSAPQRTSS